MKIEIASPAPVLNTPDFSYAFGGHDGATIPLDERGLPHCYEFVALPGMHADVVERVGRWIARVSFPFYLSSQLQNSSSPLFLDLRFTRPPSPPQPTTRPRIGGGSCQSNPQKISWSGTTQMPSREKILSAMLDMVKTPYVWGGNWHEGIAQLLEYYPPRRNIDDITKTLWTLQGVDCSGLLFEATHGLTPRNTSQLASFGEPLSHDDAAHLQPLDMILWKGHVLFVVDTTCVIESRFSRGGVVVCDLHERLAEIRATKKFVSAWQSDWDRAQQFMIRRFLT